MKRLRRIIESIAAITGDFAGWLVVAMIALIFFEVFMRYGLNRPPAIADEISAYMLVGLSFLGAAFAWKEKSHIRITSLTSRLPTKVASWLRLTTLVCVFLYVLILCLSSYGFMGTSYHFHMASATWIRVPLQGPHMTLAIGFTTFLLILMVTIGRAIMNIKTGKSAEGVF